MGSDDPPQRPRPAAAPRRRLGIYDIAVVSTVRRRPLPVARARRLARHVLCAEGVARAHLAITFVGPSRIASLHRRFMGKAGVTDIVTLQHARVHPGAPLVADIYIAPEVARRNAQPLGIATREEMARLVVHGVLHALGWEHPEGERRTGSPMWKRQEALLRSARRAGVLVA